jgi:hypothetical protein
MGAAPVYWVDMKTPTEILAMSEVELIRDHARLDTRNDIREVEVAAYRDELFDLFNKFKDSGRLDEAQLVLNVLTNVGNKVRAFLDQLNPAALK